MPQRDRHSPILACTTRQVRAVAAVALPRVVGVAAADPNSAQPAVLLELYRSRWQIEVLSKRINQLLDIHRLRCLFRVRRHRPLQEDQRRQRFLGILFPTDDRVLIFDCSSA